MEEYTPVGTFAKSEEVESKQVAGFRIPVLAFFDEEATMNAHEKLFI